LKPGIRLADCTMFPFENNAGPETDTEGGKLARISHQGSSKKPPTLA
jgi:hypothetical protein